jgi:hypothetical protein
LAAKEEVSKNKKERENKKTYHTTSCLMHPTRHLAGSQKLPRGNVAGSRRENVKDGAILKLL